MKNKYTLLAIVAVSIIFSACKKYDEGPAFSLRSKQERVVNTWGPTEVIAVTSIKRDTLTASYLDARYVFTLSDYTITDNITEGGQNYLISEEGTWSFGDNKETITTTGIEFTYEMPQGTKTRERTRVRTWEIIKLKETEMWLWDITSDSVEYQFKFEPK